MKQMKMKTQVKVLTIVHLHQIQTCEFTIEELTLPEKKNLRGQSNTAQRYFNNLLKDAAKAAKNWKKAPGFFMTSESAKESDILSEPLQTRQNI